eukprot:653374-Hanusia_phi.AAC.3
MMSIPGILPKSLKTLRSVSPGKIFERKISSATTFPAAAFRGSRWIRNNRDLWGMRLRACRLQPKTMTGRQSQSF